MEESKVGVKRLKRDLSVILDEMIKDKKPYYFYRHDRWGKPKKGEKFAIVKIDEKNV